MEFLRNVFTKKHIKWSVISLIFLSAGIAVTVFGIKKSDSLVDQNIDKRWSRDEDYAFISCFVSELEAVNENTLMGYVYGIKNRLTEESLLNEDDKGRKFLYSYSAPGEVTITSNTSSVTVTTYGVGGDFFLFHPLNVVSGSLFASDEVMKDRVVLDKNAAFALFGSYDIEGQPVEINGKRHLVSGVIEEESGKMYNLAGCADSVAYISYDSPSEAFGPDKPIVTLEFLMPNPVSSFALNIVKEVVMTDSSHTEIIENNGRFKWYRLVRQVPVFPERSMNNKGIIYPYWENVARGTESILILMTILGIVFYLVPIVYMIVIIHRMWKERTVHFKDIKAYIDKKIDDHRRKRYKKEEENEEFY